MSFFNVIEAIAGSKTYQPNTYLGPVATACMIPCTNNTNASTKAMTRKAHYARDNINYLQLAYANWFVNSFTNGGTLSSGFSGVEMANGNAITINAWIEYPVSTYTQLTLNSSNTISVADNTTQLTDILGITIPINTLFYTWTHVAPTTGNNFPYYIHTGLAGHPLFYTGGGSEACNMGTSGVITSPGAITDNLTGERGYWPVAILGYTNKKTYYLCGDSRTAGIHDVADSSYDLGNLARSIGPTRAYINAGTSGTLISNTMASMTNRLALAQYCTHVIDELGINGFIAEGALLAPAIEPYKQRLSYRFKNKFYGMTTLEPVTTSSDSWATTANQTLATYNTGWGNYNTYVLGLPFGSAVFDIANQIESTQNSGKWVVNGSANYATSDGTHESTAANILIKNSGVINPNFIEALPTLPTTTLPTLTMSSVSGTSITYTTGEFTNALSGGYPYIYGVTPGAPPITIECWLKNASINAGYAVDAIAIAIQINVTTGYAAIHATDGTVTASSVNVCDGNFHHAALTVTAAGAHTLYVDGNSVATYSAAQPSLSQWQVEQLPFGCRFHSKLGVSSANNPWTGGIVDEVAVWDIIKYTGNFTPPVAPYVGNEPNLVAVWHFDNSLAGVAGPDF